VSRVEQQIKFYQYYYARLELAAKARGFTVIPTTSVGSSWLNCCVVNSADGGDIIAEFSNNSARLFTDGPELRLDDSLVSMLAHWNEIFKDYRANRPTLNLPAGIDIF
jgi:hypothetical protein